MSTGSNVGSVPLPGLRGRGGGGNYLRYRYGRTAAGKMLCFENQQGRCNATPCPRGDFVHNTCAQCRAEGHVAKDCPTYPLGT